MFFTIKRKIPFIFTFLILSISLFVTILSQLWLIDSFEKLYFNQVTETVNFVQKNLDQFLNENKKLNLNFTKNFFNKDMSKDLFIFQNINEVIYPKDKEPSKDMNKLIQMYIKGKNEQPSITLKKEGKIYCFFKASTSSGQNYYFLFHKIILPKNAETFFIYFYILLIVLTSFSFFIAHRVTGGVLKVVSTISHSLRQYLENRYIQTIDYNKKNELGELITSYNQLLETIEAPDRPPTTLQPNIIRSEEENLSETKETKLPKLNDIEISMFPKSKDKNPASLIVFQQPDTNTLNVLVAETMINDIGADAWKNRVKDNFMDLSQTGFSPEEIISKILGSTRAGDNELRPALFYGNFSSDNQKMLLFKAGPFSLYYQNSSEPIEHLQTGSTDIPEKFTRFEERDFPKGSYFVLISSTLLKGFGLNNLTLKDSVFGSIDSNISSARGYLTCLMKGMYSEAVKMKGDTIPSGGLITLYHKQD